MNDVIYKCPECGLTYWLRATCTGGFDSGEGVRPPHPRAVTVRTRRPSGSPETTKENNE